MGFVCLERFPNPINSAKTLLPFILERFMASRIRLRSDSDPIATRSFLAEKAAISKATAFAKMGKDFMIIEAVSARPLKVSTNMMTAAIAPDSPICLRILRIAVANSITTTSIDSSTIPKMSPIALRRPLFLLVPLMASQTFWKSRPSNSFLPWSVSTLIKSDTPFRLMTASSCHTFSLLAPSGESKNSLQALVVSLMFSTIHLPRGLNPWKNLRRNFQVSLIACPHRVANSIEVSMDLAMFSTPLGVLTSFFQPSVQDFITSPMYRVSPDFLAAAPMPSSHSTTLRVASPRSVIKS